MLNENFENICDWFVNNRLSFPLVMIKLNRFFQQVKLRAKNIQKLDVRYIEINIKQHAQENILDAHQTSHCKVIYGVKGYKQNKREIKFPPQEKYIFNTRTSKKVFAMRLFSHNLIKRAQHGTQILPKNKLWKIDAYSFALDQIKCIIHL